MKKLQITHVNLLQKYTFKKHSIHVVKNTSFNSTKDAARNG